MIKKLDHKGFTIVELLIATSVFSSVLFIVTFGIIQISKMFTNGFIQSQTQNMAVSLSDEISRDVEFSSTSSVSTDVYDTHSEYYYFCTSQNEYYYQPNSNVFYRIALSEIDNSCVPPSMISNKTSAQNLINNSNTTTTNNNIKILNNDPTNAETNKQSILTSVSPGLYAINLDVMYGNISNIEQNAKATQLICKPIVLIGPFCAVYSLTTQANVEN